MILNILARPSYLHENMKDGLESEKTFSFQSTQCQSFFNLRLFAQQDRHVVEFLKFGSQSAANDDSPRTLKASDTLSVQKEVEVARYARDQVQMICIRQQNSFAALDVSKEMLDAIITGHQLDPEIWNILISFRSRTNDLEETYSFRMYKPSTAGGFGMLSNQNFHHKLCMFEEANQTGPNLTEFAYLFKFADYKGVGKSLVWVNRQFGIYHRYHKDSDRTVFMLVLPNYEPAAFCLLGQIEQSATTRENVLNNPIYFHLALFTEHIHKARLCLAHYEHRLERLADDVFTFEIKDVLPFAEMYENLQSLRVIERKLAPLLAIFCSHRNVLSTLLQINTTLLESGVVLKHQFDTNTGTIQCLLESTCAYERETEYMLGRVRSTSQLISDTIALKSQNTSEVMSNRMLQDSGVIRVVTFVTLIYLPATFVAGFFGMDFFSTEDSGSSHAGISSPYLGIYFAVAIPLTILTVLYGKWMEQRIRKATQLKDSTPV